MLEEIELPWIYIRLCLLDQYIKTETYKNVLWTGSIQQQDWILEHQHVWWFLEMEQGRLQVEKKIWLKVTAFCIQKVPRWGVLHGMGAR
jgi:hypothetical protein